MQDDGSGVFDLTSIYQYEPDYAAPPGWILDERLEVLGMSHAEFARRCGRSPKLISDIIAGKAPVEPRTAIQFEKVLGVHAGIWLGIESDYRLHRERQAEIRRAEESVAWAKAFPVNELVKRGLIPEPTSDADRVFGLLSFFGVASVGAWQVKNEGAMVAYRHSPSFESDGPALATWLRLGELETEEMESASYNEAKFKRALTRIRESTAAPHDATLSQAQRLCLDSGVVLTIIRPLPKTALSGATRWLTPRKALIQLSARHMSDDHLWFSFFHEAAHVLLHSKKDIFVHDTTNKGKITEADQQADRWAADFLVPHGEWEQLTMRPPFTKRKVLQFAEEQEIAPGIIVGRLQHEKRLPWSHLNHLKARLEWEDDVA